MSRDAGATAAGTDARVLVVDDQAIARSGLVCLVDSMPGFTVAAVAENGPEAVTRAREHDVDLVLMDLRVPHVDGVETTRRLARLSRPPRVIVLTGSAVDDQALAALEAGTSGFLTKEVDPAGLRSAMEGVMNGVSPVAAEVLGLIVRKASHGTARGRVHRAELLARLTEQERCVLTLVGAGLSNVQIAGRIYLSVSGVKAHVSRILRKLDLHNRTQAAVLASELHLPDA
ncbi:response regulator transcription factor [Streptomyces sp. NPDC002506]|uniref:response regulator transcription factor n=1 Tax=Streptomyces sp. NPDC002506 TaxID=3154536 RepID=UPI0033211109